jgi:hypothetical protein
LPWAPAAEGTKPDVCPSPTKRKEIWEKIKLRKGGNVPNINTKNNFFLFILLS